MATRKHHETANEGKTNVWLTPRHVIDALGPFDLDPCAAPEPRPWPTGARHFVEAQDGLSQEWRGFVWCNPPYGPHAGAWVEKMADHGNGIALIFARADTRWFQKSVCRASILFFPEGRLSFCRLDGTEAHSNGGLPVSFLDSATKRCVVLNAVECEGFSRGLTEARWTV